MKKFMIGLIVVVILIGMFFLFRGDDKNSRSVEFKSVYQGRIVENEILRSDKDETTLYCQGACSLSLSVFGLDHELEEIDGLSIDVCDYDEVEGIMEKVDKGEIITLDSLGRAIYTGRVESLLTDVKKPEPQSGRGDHLTVILEETSQHVFPLNLMDPDSVDFKPRNCQTLHDIMQFLGRKLTGAFQREIVADIRKRLEGI